MIIDVMIQDLECAAADFMKDVNGSAFKFCSEVPNDDDDDGDDVEEDGNDKGESNVDVFNLEKMEMIEKVTLHFIYKLVRMNYCNESKILMIF